jgi:hypothetical protein
MSSKARSIAREVSRQRRFIEFADCVLDVVIAPLREKRNLCPACRAKRKAAGQLERQQDCAEGSDRNRAQ